MKLSIITSLKPNEIIDPVLKENLIAFAIKAKEQYDLEWLLVSGDEKTLALNCSSGDEPSGVITVKKIWGGHSRASCMNLGAEKALGDLLWFLHADSSFSERAIEKFLQKKDFENKIYYFHLKFSQGPSAMKLNEWGVRFRCRFLKTPFGDQGLSMSKLTFLKLGGYDENVPYGEDHLLIRKAWKYKIDIVPLGESLVTSPRKYQENGWFKTTLTHQYLWYKQILSQRFKRS